MQPIEAKNVESSKNNDPAPELENVFDKIEYCIKRLPSILVQLEYWIIRLLLFGLLLIAAYDLIRREAVLSGLWQ